MSRRALLGLAVAVVTPLALVACSSKPSKDAIGVEAGDETCEVAKTELAAGRTTFAVENVGGDVTEVYVYGEDDEVIGEVENIGPGTSRDLTVDLRAGDYEVACKPGQKGDGIRTPIEVVGFGGGKALVPTRSVELVSTDYAFDGLTGLRLGAGEVIEFRMSNEGPAEEHEFEVFDPSGEAIGEIGPTKPGDAGRVVLELGEAGTYTYICNIDDHAARGMQGELIVS